MSEEKLGQHYLAALNEAFPGVVLDHAWQTKDQLTVTVKVNYLPEVVEFLYYKQGGWLSVLFGNDERKLNGHYAVYYVLSMEKGTKCWVTVRVEVDANKPEYPSVTPRVPAAVWGEREVRDMYGLIPVGLPDERRLVLPDDWPDELYPLRKDSMDYRQRPAPTTDAETYEFINELGDKKTTSCRLVRCTSLLTNGPLPSVRRWRKHYRRRLPSVLRSSRHGKTGGNPYGLQRSDLPL